MSEQYNQHHLNNWHVLADRFIWSDEVALSEISYEVSDEEIQRYLYTFHGDNMALDEIRQWRGNKPHADSH